MSDKKKTFIFNLEWSEVLLGCEPEVRLEVYDAIMRYAQSGTLAEMKPLARMAFAFIKREMDYNKAQYEATIERKREAGRKGGSKAKQTQADLSTAKQSQADSSTAKQTEAQLSKAKQTQAGLSTAKQSQAKLSIYDNEYDNDNIPSYEGDIMRVRERTKHTPAQILEKFISENQITLESICMDEAITLDDFRHTAEKILRLWQLDKWNCLPIEKGNGEFSARHLINEVKSDLKKSKINLTNDSTKNNPAGGRKGSKLPPAPGFGLA